MVPPTDKFPAERPKMPSPALMAASTRMPWRFLLALSFSQLISYGTVFYSFALIIEQMERDLGWSKSALGGAYSLALVSFALCAVPVGRLIDRGYGRWVMTGGSALAALLLTFWAYADSISPSC